MSAINGLRVVPAMLNTQSGPERHLGPENAGAILVLQGTFVDEARFAEFWMTGCQVDDAAGDRAGLHPSLQLHRRAALHADRAVALGRGRAMPFSPAANTRRRCEPPSSVGGTTPISPDCGRSRSHGSDCSSARPVTASRRRPRHAALAAARRFSIPSETLMSQQLQAFLEEWSPTQISTGRDMHSGDPSSWMQAWSHQEPVSVFGAGVRVRSGWDAVLRTITWVASRFEECSDYEYELVVADVHGDLAYTCGFERYTATRSNGGPGHDRAARHPDLPTRGRRVEDRPSTRRPPARRPTRLIKPSAHT